MKNVSIRRMQVSDIDAVAAVEQASFSLPWSRQAFEEELRNILAYYLVLVVDGNVVGYAGAWFIMDEAHITNIAVLPEYRSMGLGERLVEKLIFDARLNGIKSVTLEVRTGNIVARKLYEKLGFQARGLRRQYYSDNKEDAIIMWLEIR